MSYIERSQPSRPYGLVNIPMGLLLLALMLAAIDLVERAVASGRTEAKMEFTISSPSFTEGGSISKKFTCEGEDVSPQLTWSNSPKGTVTFALLVDDPDAPVGNWSHWAIWNIPGESQGLSEAVPKDPHLANGSVQGTNDFRRIGYNGPCPPAGKPHRYYFRVFALDRKLNVESTAGKRELEAAMKGHILSQAEWMGRYQRSLK